MEALMEKRQSKVVVSLTNRKNERKDRTVKKETALETKDLHVYYGSNLALKNISMPIYKNQVTAFIGPSGCGKSTYLRSLNRMNDEIQGCRVEGSIFYKEFNINQADVNVFEIRKNIGMVFQRPNPFAKSIFDNVAFGPKQHGEKNKKVLQEIVEKAYAKRPFGMRLKIV